MGRGISVAQGEALEARGIDLEVAAKLGLWTLPGKDGGEALVFPFFRGGQVVNEKFRTSIKPGVKGKLWQAKGGKQIFWNEDALRDTSLDGAPVIITEGEFDAIAAIQNGYARTVSVPAGAPDQSVPLEHGGSKYAFIEEAKSLLSIDRVKEIILAVDNDEKGGYLLHDLSIRLGRFRCKFLTYPKDPNDNSRRLKDLNEVQIAYGAKGVHATLKTAQWLKVDGVFRMSELPPVPDVKSFDNGFPHLREKYRVRLGDLAVITGIPSHGKSSFVNDLCCRLAKTHLVKTAFFSPEQNPQRDHRKNLRVWFNQKPVSEQTGEELARADHWIDDRFAFIYPDEDADPTLDWLMDRAEAARFQYDCDVIVIDPWNEIEHSRLPGESVTDYTSRAIRGFKRFARKMNVHLIIVAHPTKLAKDKEGNYPVPSLYDISDSAAWYNRADVGVIVHRFSSHSIVRVSKSRYHDEIGQPGEVSANFEPRTRRFEIVDSLGGDYGD